MTQPTQSKKTDVPIAVVLVVVGLVGVGVLALVNVLTKPRDQPVSTGAPVAGGTTAPSWPAVPLDQASVQARLNAKGLQPTNITVDGGTVVVQYKPNVWDENTVVQKAGDLGIDTANALHDHSAVEQVTTGVLGEFTDQYGKSETEVALSSTVTKATMAKITWEGLKNRVTIDGSDWLCIADAKDVHPAVLKAVETKRGLLPGPCP